MRSTMNRVLVAGATGYLGGFVAREFRSRAHRLEEYFRNLAGKE